ncbi:MAG TPA: hypothetical protein VGP68_11470 [Gemmataceae bacterium]|nr:hypothetical protein [Gemmataceae bacterium]
MTRNLRHHVFITAASLLALSALTLPANAIHPPGFRFMPVFRITPAMNGMRGTINGMQTTSMFNVRTGVMAVPTFRNPEMMMRDHRDMRLLNHEMRNLDRNALLMSGIGMTGSLGYPSLSSGYGGSGGNAQMSSVPMPVGDYEGNFATTANVPDASRILTAAGLPNDQGRLNWPIGLQVLFPVSEYGESFLQLEARLETAALAKANGSVDSKVLDEANQDVGKMRSKLRQRKSSMMAPTYAEADRFLQNLDGALKQLQGNKAGSSAK